MGLCSSALPVQRSKEQYMMASPLSCAVTDEEALDVAACFGVRRFSPRQRVPLGNDEFYVVAEGDVDVSTVVPSAIKNVHLREFLCNRRGGDILYGHTERRTAVQASREDEAARRHGKKGKNVLDMVDTTTARAGVEGALLLKLDKVRLNALRAQRPTLAWRTFDELMGVSIVDQLRPLPLLQGVSDSRVHMLATLCSYMAAPRGEVICRENEAADAFFVLLHGSLSVQAQGKEITVLLAPTYFGEAATMLRMTRSASVVAKERSLLLEIERTHFRNYASMVPSVESHVMNQARHNLLDKFVASGTPFFSGFSPDELEELEARLEIVEVPASEVLFQEGDRGDAFYIIAHGTLLVETSQGPITLGSGKYFGELSLVLDEPRRATVAASTDAVLLALSRKSFKAFFKPRMERLSETKIKILQTDAGLEHILDHAPSRALFREHMAREHNDEHLRFWEAVIEYRRMYRRAAGAPDETELTSRLAAFARSGDEGVQRLRSEGGGAGGKEEEDDEEVHPANERQFRGLMQRIFAQFVQPGAPDEVNISSPMRQAALAAFETSCAPAVLDKVLAEVFLVMERDGFARFLQSAAYKGYLADLGVYTEVAVGNSKALSNHMLRAMTRARSASQDGSAPGAADAGGGVVASPLHPGLSSSSSASQADEEEEEVKAPDHSPAPAKAIERASSARARASAKQRKSMVTRAAMLQRAKRAKEEKRRGELGLGAVAEEKPPAPDAAGLVNVQVDML